MGPPLLIYSNVIDSIIERRKYQERINPRIVEMRDVDNQTIFSVLYDVMLRKNEYQLSKRVRE
jgi:hypothetical protein